MIVYVSVQLPVTVRAWWDLCFKYLHLGNQPLVTVLRWELRAGLVGYNFMQKLHVIKESHINSVRFSSYLCITRTSHGPWMLVPFHIHHILMPCLELELAAVKQEAISNIILATKRKWVSKQEEVVSCSMDPWYHDYSGKHLTIKLWTLKKETSTRMILQGPSFINVFFPWLTSSYQGDPRSFHVVFTCFYYSSYRIRILSSK